MDLKTTYLGFQLPHPFIAGASPLSATLEGAQRLEQGGAAAIVLPSLFEEGVTGGETALRAFYADADPEVHLDLIPSAAPLGLSPKNYLAHLGRVKKAVRVPVIASLNGTGPGGWIRYAADMEREGADALELNLYAFSTEALDPSSAAELRMLELVRSLKAAIRVPLAVKLSPFFTSIPHFVRELDHAKVDGVVLFNRFYQADVDLEKMDLIRTLDLSSSSELLLRLRWIAALHGRIRSSIAATGGVHTAQDAVKAVVCGAHVVQIVSALMERGAEHLETLRRETQEWLEQHHHSSLGDLRGRLSLLRAPSPTAHERMNYIYNLEGWYGSIPDPVEGRQRT